MKTHKKEAVCVKSINKCICELRILFMQHLKSTVEEQLMK